MAQKATHDDVNVLSLEGNSYLSQAQRATITSGADLTDPTSLGDIAGDSCPQKLFVDFAVSLMDDVSGGCRVGGIDVSALTLDSVNIYAEVEACNFTIQNIFVRADGIGDKWRKHSFVRQDISGSLTMLVPTSFAALDQPVLDTFSETIPNHDMVLAFTVDGASWSIGFVVQSMSHDMSRGDNQRVTFTLAPGGGATLPAGTGSLILEGLNAPSTSQTLALESKAVGGIAYAGEFLMQSASFAFNRGELIVTDYSYISEGAITATATTV